MAVSEKNILHRFYIIAIVMFLFAAAIVFKLVDIQFVDGDHYRELAKTSTTKSFVIPANRGNVYADDGSLLATSVPRYDIRFDAVTVSNANFEKYAPLLAKALGEKFNQPASLYLNVLQKARSSKNRYKLIAKNLGYTDYKEIKSFPLFNLGPYKGGIIVEQRTVREHPIGKIAERMVGYERVDESGNTVRVGLEGAFSDYLNGRDGKRLKQKIAQGQWKPIYDENEVEPQDGYDVISTINVGIQDIAHHALLKQLETYEADHGTVIVMDVETGEIKGVSNLGRTSVGTYYEKWNYAIGEAHEPGSTFKTMAFLTAIDQQVIDTSTMVDTGNGVYSFYGKKISDSKRGGYGKISAGRVMEVSSNIGLARLIDESYKDNPKKFVERLQEMRLDNPIGLPVAGEGKPMIPHPDDKKVWSKNALPSMSYGYGLTMTPLQVLTFYNAIANNGEMVKPRFIKEIRAWNKPIETFDKEILHPKIASDETIKIVQDVLKNIVEKGTGKGLYSPNFSMAGKTGTAQTEYWMKDWENNKRYVSSFVGYFPAENPKYSCIVVIHKPKVNIGYYGADVSGPVFKSIAQKIYIDSPSVEIVEDLNTKTELIAHTENTYKKIADKENNLVPNLIGLPGMDAVALLSNMGLQVTTSGNGKVIKQSIPKGQELKQGQKIHLQLAI